MFYCYRTRNLHQKIYWWGSFASKKTVTDQLHVNERFISLQIHCIVYLHTLSVQVSIKGQCQILQKSSLLKMQAVYWFKQSNSSTLKDEANTILRTSRTTQQSTRRNVPKDLNSEQQLCQNLRSRVIFHVVQRARPKGT